MLLSRPVTALDRPSSDHVVIQCPKCGASESAEPGVLTDAPTIVCRECGETWPAQPPRRPRNIDLVLQTRSRVNRDIVDAEHRPLVTYSDGAESAWAAKAAGDYWPEPPRQRRLPLIAAATAALFFLTAFFGARDAAVSVLPDLAGLYATIGLPVSLEGLAIEDVAADRSSTADGDRIVVRGTVRNVSGRDMTVRQLSATLYDNDRVPALAESFDPPAGTISAGQTMPFLFTLDSAPPHVTRVAVRFSRANEAPAGATDALLRATP